MLPAMSIPTRPARAQLTKAGFDEVRGALVAGAHFVFPLVPSGWRVVTFLKDGDEVPHLDLQLDCRGTLVGNLHRVTSIEAFGAHLPRIVLTLGELADTSQLKCPKCRERWAAVREPRTGQPWEPYLACTGVAVLRSSQGKGTPCDGTSKALQPVVIY